MNENLVNLVDIIIIKIRFLSDSKEVKGAAKNLRQSFPKNREDIASAMEWWDENMSQWRSDMRLAMNTI